MEIFRIDSEEGPSVNQDKFLLMWTILEGGLAIEEASM